jgi:ketol-acid reductoisomerase
MTKIFYDADLSVLTDKTVAVLGYGNQGRAQALNMRDSGLEVVVGNIEDAYAKQARKEKFEVHSIEKAANLGEVVCLLLPDEVQPELYQKYIRPYLGKGKTLDFSSGFNIFFRMIRPPKSVDVVMVAPKMIGEGVRKIFLEGKGAPSLVAVHQDGSGYAWKTAVAIAKAIGATRAGALKSSFEEEVVTDLFNEQCTPFIPLLIAGYEVLTEAGYDPIATQLELYGSGEWLQIIKAMLKYGVFGQGRLHSTTSQYGQLTRSQRIVTPELKEEMRRILKDIQSGKFAEEWLNEMKAGYPTLNELKRKADSNPLRKTEAEVRKRIKVPLT